MRKKGLKRNKRLLTENKLQKKHLPNLKRRSGIKKHWMKLLDYKGKQMQRKQLMQRLREKQKRKQSKMKLIKKLRKIY